MIGRAWRRAACPQARPPEDRRWVRVGSRPTPSQALDHGRWHGVLLTSTDEPRHKAISQGAQHRAAGVGGPATSFRAFAARAKLPWRATNQSSRLRVKELCRTMTSPTQRPQATCPVLAGTTARRHPLGVASCRSLRRDSDWK